jgi:hypothetical protein
MDNNNPNYKERISELESKKNNQEIQHTVYLSRRAIWANVIWCILIPIAGYIHTRRWQQLGILSISIFVFSVITAGDDSFEEGLERGKKMSPLIALIAMIDNGIAIKKAQEKVNK